MGYKIAGRWPKHLARFTLPLPCLNRQPEARVNPSCVAATIIVAAVVVVVMAVAIIAVVSSVAQPASRCVCIEYFLTFF